MLSIMSPLLRLTCGVVENWSFRTAAGFVECEHRHQVREATLALVAAVVAAGVAGLLTAIGPLDVGHVAVSVRHRGPRQRAVSF